MDYEGGACGSSLSFSSVGFADEPLPALSPQSLFDERKVVNRNSSGGGAIVESRDAPVGTQPPIPPPVYFPQLPSQIKPRIFGIDAHVALAILASNFATVIVCALLILLAV